MRKIVLSIFAVLTFCLGAVAQNQRVTGTVTDPDGVPAIGVTVSVVGTTVATNTDANGNYSINVARDGSLEFSYVGMETQTIAVAGRTSINLAMKADTHQIDDVIVVAYGTAKKESFTGSAAVIGNKELKTRKVANLTKAIDGLAPGIQSTSGSGQPGSGTSIVIRGVGSINASSSPLYVVDGVPYGGSISAINPDDIESISILKDASASVLYGSRGANGVILVNTRKGSTGGVTINLKASYGVSSRSIENYETLGTKDFIETMYSAFYQEQLAGGVAKADAGLAALKEMSSGASKIFGKNEQYNPYNYAIYDETNPSNQLIDPSTGKIRSDAKLLWDDNWMDMVTNNKAVRQEYVFSINGGNEKTQYMFSGGYLNEDGTLATTNFERFTGRLNIETAARDWLNAGIGANFSRGTTNSLEQTGSYTSNVWYSAFLMSPYFPIYERDRDNNGEYILDADGNKLFDYGTNRPTGQQGDFNSIATLYDDKYSAVTDNFSTRAHVDLLGGKDGILDGLKFQVNLGVDYYNSLSTQAYNPYHGNAADVNGRLYKTNGNQLTYTLNELLTYNKKINENNIDILLGHEYYSLEYKYLRGHKTGFPFGGLYELDGGSTVQGASSYTDRYNIESYFARLNYDFADKYYLSASWRTDGSSRFHKDNRWGQFWSVGANWRVSQEEFMQNIEWLNNLSVKASYGAQGNDALSSYYAWQALYDLGWSNATESGALVTSVSTPKVSWETNYNLNVGVEARIANRFDISVEWYRRTTDGMLLNYPLALSTGFDGYNRNSGIMVNSGIEASITAAVVNTRNFQWNLTLMGSTVKNNVVKLTDDGNDILSGNYLIREGEALYSFYVPRSAGINPVNGDQLYWAYKTYTQNDVAAELCTAEQIGDKIEGSDYITNSKTAALASRVVAGSRMPKLYGSITNQFVVGNFDFSISTNYSIGGKVLDGVYNTLMSYSYAAQAKHVNTLRAWQEPGDVTDVRRYQISESTITTDADLIDASYFSIKNITFGYTLPTSYVNRLGIKGLRASITADNVVLFTHLKGMNPQNNFTGGTSFSYVPTRTIAFNLDFSF